MQYVLRRTALLVPTVLTVVALVFLLVRVVPGDVVTLLVHDQAVSEAQAEALRDDLGLNDSIARQFSSYLAEVATGDFGESIWTGDEVSSEFLDRLPVTLELAILASIFSLLLGIPLGVLSALHRDRWPDHVLRGFAVAGLSVPAFWLATLAIVLPAIWWGYTPPLRYVSLLDDPVTNLRQFLPPAFIMSLVFGAVLMRLTRSSMLEVLGQDYMRAARARGLRERTVVIRHGLRNALLPVITMFGTQVAVLLGGTVIVEQVFNLKGVGTYVLQAVNQRDYPVIQSANLFLAFAIVGINLAVDLSYFAIDPRTRTPIR